jgi:hypothetical protein
MNRYNKYGSGDDDGYYESEREGGRGRGRGRGRGGNDRGGGDRGGRGRGRGRGNGDREDYGSTQRYQGPPKYREAILLVRSTDERGPYWQNADGILYKTFRDIIKEEITPNQPIRFCGLDGKIHQIVICQDVVEKKSDEVDELDAPESTEVDETAETTSAEPDPETEPELTYTYIDSDQVKHMLLYFPLDQVEDPEAN